MPVGTEAYYFVWSFLACHLACIVVLRDYGGDLGLLAVCVTWHVGINSSCQAPQETLPAGFSVSDKQELEDTKKELKEEKQSKAEESKVKPLTRTRGN